MEDHLTFRRGANGRFKNSNRPIRWQNRLIRVGIVGTIILLALLIVATFITVPFEAITPGSTVDVSRLISVSANIHQKVPGSVSLVDVNLVPLRAISYLFYRLNTDDQVVATKDILGANSQATYDEQGVLDMVSAQQAATYVAFRQLGYAIQARPDGVAVYEIISGSPLALGTSKTSLMVGDVIRKVDGIAINDVASLRNVILRHRVGELLRIEVQLYGQSAEHVVDLRLGELSKNKAGYEVCTPISPSKVRSLHNGAPCIGVVLMPLYQFANQPFAVNLNAEGIIGPSAGLAFTLGLIHALDKLNLTNGRSIAATGTIAMDGSIGDVGGVAQKTIAVRTSGASVFFVPKSEYQIAKSKAGPHLRIFPVTSISQVIRDLESLGGQIFKRVPR